MAAFCPLCGSAIVSNSNFCNVCGAALPADIANNPYAYNGMQPQPQPQPYPQPQPQPYNPYNGGGYVAQNAPTIPGFGGAFSVCMKKYFSCDGRASRSEYWFFHLWCILIYLALWFVACFCIGFVGTLQGVTEEELLVLVENAEPAVACVFGIIFFFPSLTVTIRRLHDANRSGANWLLTFLLGIGWVILFVYMVSEPTRGPNRYGMEPTRR